MCNKEKGERGKMEKQDWWDKLIIPLWNCSSSLFSFSLFPPTTSQFR